MALSNRTIQDSINWAKRFNFNRNPVIGNSLEPALTSANIVLQTILGPPFEWWWNSEDVVFTCNPTPVSATSTAAALVAKTLTVTATNTFSTGQAVIASGFVGNLKGLNGQILSVVTASGSQFTAVVNLPDASDTAGTFTSATTQDYSVGVNNFSHIEHAGVLDLDANNQPVKWYQLTVKSDLALESSQNRPEFVGTTFQDGTGNVTFRVFSAPDKPYPVSIRAQLAAVPITSINQTWAPLPDFMQYVYDWGFLALMWLFADDPRATYAENKFKAALLGRAEGLTEEQKNIFLNNWEALQEGYLMKLQQGTTARGQ